MDVERAKMFLRSIATIAVDAHNALEKGDTTSVLDDLESIRGDLEEMDRIIAAASVGSL